MIFNQDEFQPVNVYLYCEDPSGQQYWSSQFQVAIKDYCWRTSTYQPQSQGDIKAKQFDSTPGDGTNKQVWTNSSSTYLTIPSDPKWHSSQTCKFKDCEWSYFQTTVPGTCGTTSSTNPTVKSFDLAAQTWTFEIDTSVTFENRQCYRCNWQNSGSSINNRWNYNGWISVQVKASTDCTFFLGTNQVKFFDGGNSYTVYDYRVASGSFGVANIATGYAYITYLTGGNKYATTSDLVNCPLSYYVAVSAQSFSASNPMSNYVNCDYNTGLFQYRTDSLYSYWFRITIYSQITNSDGTLGSLYFVNTNWFLIDITCGPNSQVATDPSTLKIWQIWEINNAQPYFTFTDQTFGNTDCKCYYSQKKTQSTSASGVNDLDQSVSPSSLYQSLNPYYVKVSSGQINNEATYQFYLLTSCDGGYTRWASNPNTAVNTSNIMTLVVYCGLNSGFITQTSNYYSTLSDPQYVGKSDVNTLGTKYVLPKFTDATYCVIITYQSSSSNTAVVNPGSGFVQDPVTFTLNSAFKQLEPHDKTVDATYQFYIKVTQTGGKTLFSSLMTLVVGCQSTGTTWTDGTNNAKSVIVGSTTTKVYTFTAPSISNIYCVFASHNIINVVNSRLTPSTNGVLKSTTCSSLTCLDLDLYSTQVTQTITFQIRTCTTFGNLCRTSPTITITVVCSAQSNTASYGGQLISTMDNFTATYSQYVINQNFGIKPFTCTYTDCCQTFTYSLVSDSANPTTTTYAQSIFTTPLVSGSQYQTTVYTGEIKTYYLYVYVKTEWTNTFVSTKVTINVIYNCSFVKISQNTTMPYQGNDNNKFSSEGYPYINYQNSSEGLPYILIDETIGVTKGFKVDITKMFVKNTTNCPEINKYVIYQVIQNSTSQNISSSYYNSLFTLGINNGTFQLLDLNSTEYYNYQITINASNGDVWGGTLEKQPQIYATLRRIFQFPTYPPYFDPYEFSLVQNITINLIYKIDDKGNEIYTNSKEDIVVNIPSVHDKQDYETNITYLDPDQVKFVIFDVQPLNWSQNILIIEQKGLKKQDIGTYKVFLKVTNIKGASSLYKFFIFVRVQGQSIPKIIKQKKDLYKGKHLVHAQIKRVTEDGIMIVKFNQSMLTNFDYLSQLNNETISIFVLPALNRDLEYGYDNRTVQLKWTLLNFTNDTMIFQLYFFQPDEISPLIVFDKIVLNFTNAAHLLFSKKNMLDKGNEYKIMGRNLIEKSDYVYDQLEQRLLLDPQLYPYDPVFFVLFGKIPRQNSEYNKSWIDSVADIMVDLILVGLFLGMIIGCFFSNTIWFVLAYIRYLQICLHLPMLSIPVPSNVMRFMRRSLPAAKIDVFRYFWKEISYQDLFDWDTQRTLQQGVPDQTVELGYETHNALVNLSGLAFYLTLALALIILVKLLSISCKIVRFDIEKKLENTRLYRPYLFLADLIFYRVFLFVVLFGFMEFIIAGYQGVQTNLQSTIPEQIQIYFSYICLYLAVLFLPTVYCYILKNNLTFQKSEEFNLKISPEQNPNNAIDVSINLSEGQSFIEVPSEDQENQNPERTFEQTLNLHEGGEKYLDYDKEDDLEKMKMLYERQQKIKQQFSMLSFALHENRQLSSYFYPLYLLRRVLYLLIVQYVQNYIFQFLLMCLLNFISMCYVAHSNPMSTRLQNYVENFNQLSEVFVTLHLAWYTDYVLIHKQQVQFYGLMQIIVICSHGLISLMIIYYWIAKHLYLILLKIYFMFFQKFFERLAKWCWTRSVCWRKCFDERELDLNDVEINELKPGTQTENDKGGFSANYLIMQKLNQNKKPLNKKKLRQLVNLNPKKAMILNMPEILEEVNENETINQEDSPGDKQKVKKDQETPENPVNPLDIPSQTQNQIQIPFHKEAMKIYGEENDDSDFENSGPIYYDFNEQDKVNGDGLEGMKQSFRESAPVYYDIKIQGNIISTVDQQEQQIINLIETIDQGQIEKKQTSLLNQQKNNITKVEKSLFEPSPKTAYRQATPEFNESQINTFQVDKQILQDNDEDFEFGEGPIYYDFNDQDKSIQSSDLELYQITQKTETNHKQKIDQNQISSLSKQPIKLENTDKSIFKPSPISSYRANNPENNQNFIIKQTIEDEDSFQQIKLDTPPVQSEEKVDGSDSEIEQGPIYYDFNE